MFSSILKVLVVVARGLFNILVWHIVGHARLNELTLAHALLTKDVISIIAIYVKMFLFVVIL